MFYLGDKLNRKELEKFFYRMSTALGYDHSKMLVFASIYASHGLFDSAVITDKEFKQLFRLAPCQSCSKLRKQNAYKKYELDKNACCMCEYSESYRNVRCPDEHYVLRYLMKPNVKFQHFAILANVAFYSVNRMCDDYAIGTFPVISLNSLLYCYLADHPFQSECKDSFIEDFCKYVYSNSNVGEHDIAYIHNQITFYISDIMLIDAQEISIDRYNKLTGILNSDYVYVPFLVNATVVSSSTNIQPDSQNLIETNDTGEVIGQTDFPSNEECIVEPTYDIQDVEHESESFTTENIVLENVISSPITNDEKDTIQDVLPTFEEELQDIVPANEDLPPIIFSPDDQLPFSMENDFLNTDSIDEVPPTLDDPGALSMNNLYLAQASGIANTAGFEISKNIEDSLEEDTYMLHPSYINDTSMTHNDKNTLQFNKACDESIYLYHDFTDLFNRRIVTVTAKNTFQFMLEFERSYFICIEPAKRFKHGGLLLYTSYRKTFYFCDIELCGGEMLAEYLSSPNAKILSFHPMQVLHIIQLFGGRRIDSIIGLDVLYGFYRKSVSFTLESVIEDLLGSSIPDVDLCRTAMPLYPELFNILDSHASTTDEFHFKYRRTMRLYSVLSRSLGLYNYSHQLNQAFVETSFLHYKFLFNWQVEWRKKGVIYRISIPGIDMNTGFTPDSLLIELCLIFDTLHHSYIENSRIISISSEALYLFFEGDIKESRHFYDILIMALQRVYTNYTNKELRSNTYCVIYQ